MSMIFLFRALSGEDEKFIRDYEIRYDATLKEFHEFIAEDLGFDEEELASFYLCDDDWNKLHEFTLFDMGMDEAEEDNSGPQPMSKVILGQIIQKKHQRLLYTFDIVAERGLFIELMESKKEDESKDYPVVVASEGKAPIQFLDEEEEDVYGDMMDDFDDFEDAYNEDEFEDEFGGGGGSYEEERYY